MTFKSPHANHRANKKAIAWALFSQSIWIPALLTDTQDQISTMNNDYDFSGVAANIPNQNLPQEILHSRPPVNSANNLIATTPQTYQNNGVVLNTILPKERDIERKITNIHPTSTGSITLSSPTRQTSFQVSLNSSKQIQNRKVPEIINSSRANVSSKDLLRRLYSLSDLLGGSLTLGDMDEPLMPPIARAERAQSSRSGDPLATIPQIWREPMRKALKNLSDSFKPASVGGSSKSMTIIAVDQARVIHVPSARVKRFSEVPLALQSDGTVDILNSPDDPEVVEEIKSWSSKQQLPEKGRMAPAVIQLHPLPQNNNSPVSEKITSSGISLSPEKEITVQPTQPATADVQEASIPASNTPESPAPTPPPPLTESHTSNSLPVEVEPTIAEAPLERSAPAVSTGEIQ